MSATRVSRFARRVVRTCLVCLASVAFCTLLALGALVCTSPGRQILLERGLEAANRALPGTLRIARLTAIEPWAIEVAEVTLDDPHGTRVVELARLRVEVAALEWWHGKLAFTRVTAGPGFVDLGELEARDRGLVAACIPPEPTQTSDSPLPDLTLERIELDGIELRFPALPRVGEVRARNATLRARLALQPTPHVAIERFELDLQRDGQQLGRLARAQGSLEFAERASQLAFGLTLGGLKLAADMEATLPNAANWQTAPLRATLSAHGIQSDTLAQLTRDPTLEERFRGPLAWRAELSGSARQLELSSELDTPGGQLRAHATLDDFERADLRLASDTLHLNRLHPDLPARKLQFRWRARSTLSRPEGGRHFQFDAERTLLDGQTLPELHASGTWGEHAIKTLDLNLNDAHSHAQVTGQLGFDGSAEFDLNAKLKAPTLALLDLFSTAPRPPTHGSLHAQLRVRRASDGALDAHGTLQGRALHVGNASVRTLDARLALQGGDLPRGRVTLKAQDARLGDRRITYAELSATGDARAYRVRGHTRTAESDLQLDVELRPSRQSLRVAGQAVGTIRGLSVLWKADPTDVALDGSALRSDGVHLTLGAGTLHARGRVDRRRADLEFDAPHLELAQLSELLELEPALTGSLALAGSVKGAWSTPQIALDVRGTDLRRDRAHGPGVDAQLETELDAAAGTLALRLKATPSASAQSEFPPRGDFLLRLNSRSRFVGGERWTRALTDPDHQFDAEVAIDDLNADWVRAWFPQIVLPFDGTLHSKAKLGGRLGAPELDLSLNAEGRFPGEDLVQMSLDERYAHGKARTKLRLRDAHGPLLDAQLGLELESLSAQGLLAFLPEAPRRAAWQLRFEIPQRPLAHFPLVPTLPAGMADATLEARGALSFQPDGEPLGEVSFALRPPARALGLCRSEDVTISGQVRLETGSIRAQARAVSPSGELAHLEAQTAGSLKPLLSGEAPSLADWLVQARAHGLDLKRVPIVCQFADGELDAHATLEAPLGKSPRARLEARARQLTLNGRHAVHASLLAEADASSARATLEVAGARTPERISRARWSTPLDWSHGKLRVPQDAPLNATVELDGLPVAPFVPHASPVSYVSGALSGRLSARGTWQKPDLLGDVRLERLGFTITELGQPLHGIEGRLHWSERRLQLERGVARDGEGTLNVDGQLDFSDLRALEAQLRVIAHQFPVRQHGQIVAKVALDADVEGRLEPGHTQLRVRLRRADTWLTPTPPRAGIDLAPHPDIVVDGATPPARITQRGADSPRGAPPAIQASGAPNPDAATTTLILDARDRFWVKREDFAVKLSTQLTSELQGERALVKGRVAIERGYLALFGKVFDIERSSRLEFIGSPTPDPAVDVHAVHTNRRSGARVRVHIGGRGSAPQLTFFVDGQERSAGDAFLAVYEAQKSDAESLDAEKQAAAFVGGVTAGLLATSARRELGSLAPILMLEPGETTSEGRLRAGFELGSLVPDWLKAFLVGVYVEGVLARDAETARGGARTQGGALFELYFPRGYFSTGQYGPGPGWSLDVGWQR